jgi:hypothetical protein
MLTKFLVDFFVPHLIPLFSDLVSTIALPPTPSLHKRGLFSINRVTLQIPLIPTTNHYSIPLTITLVTNLLLTLTDPLLLDE